MRCTHACACTYAYACPYAYARTYPWLHLLRLQSLAHAPCTANPGRAAAPQALEYLHSRGVVHADLKDGNLLLSWQGNKPVAKVTA